MTHEVDFAKENRSDLLYLEKGFVVEHGDKSVILATHNLKRLPIT